MVLQNLCNSLMSKRLMVLFGLTGVTFLSACPAVQGIEQEMEVFD